MGILDLLIAINEAGVHGPWRLGDRIVTFEPRGSTLPPAVADELRRQKAVLLTRLQTCQQGGVFVQHVEEVTP